MQVEIGQRFDPPLSRERVRQILEKQGFQKKKWIHFCATPGCKETKTFWYRSKVPIHCARCNSYKVRHKKYPPREWFEFPKIKSVQFCTCGRRSDETKFWKNGLCGACAIKEYRKTHPEYVKKVRKQQRIRNHSEYHLEYTRRKYVMKMLNL